MKMQAILHISESATQEVIQQINQINLLSKPLIQREVHQHCDDVDDAIVREILNVSQSNALLKHTNNGGSLSTAARRGSYILG